MVASRDPSDGEILSRPGEYPQPLSLPARALREPAHQHADFFDDESVGNEALLSSHERVDCETALVYCEKVQFYFVNVLTCCQKKVLFCAKRARFDCEKFLYDLVLIFGVS